MTRLPIPLRGGLEGLLSKELTRQIGDSVGVPPTLLRTNISLPKLTEVVSDLVLRIPRLLVLGELNIHAEDALTVVA